MIIDLIGYAGAAVVLAAYALTNLRRVRVAPRTLAMMNLGAGLALALNGLVHQAWPSTVVNTVWFAIAVITLSRRHSDRASAPSELQHAGRR